MTQRKVVIPRFQVVRRGQVIRVIPVHRARLVVGSEDGAHLRLKHPAIAPRHVEITVVDGRYLEAANLAGEGRVLLGNQPMNRARLREGDELDLGPVALRLTYERTGLTATNLKAVKPGSPPPGSSSDAPMEDEPTVDEPAASPAPPAAVASAPASATDPVASAPASAAAPVASAPASAADDEPVPPLEDEATVADTVPARAAVSTETADPLAGTAADDALASAPVEGEAKVAPTAASTGAQAATPTARVEDPFPTPAPPAPPTEQPRASAAPAPPKPAPEPPPPSPPAEAPTLAPTPPAAPISSSPDGMFAVDLDEIVLDPTPVVEIEPPRGRPQRVPLRVGSFVVGAGRCAFRLSYPGVAPAHAEMMVMPDGAVYLKHLAGSGLLTLRNGAPVQFSRWNSGDRLQIGPVSMTLHMEPLGDAAGPAEPQAAPPAEPAAPTPAPERPAAAAAAAAAAPPAAPPPADLPPPGRRGVVARPPSSDLPSMVARRAVPTPTPRPAPPPKRPAKPLVRVRGRKKKAARKLAQSSSPLDTTNSVEVRLELTAEDTFDTYRLDDIEYRRPFFQRALMPAVIVLLLLVLGWQTATQLGLLDGSSETTSAPRTARGQSGLAGADVDAAAAGSRVSVGDPTELLEARRARAAERGEGYDYGGPGNIDWDDRSRASFQAGRAYSKDHSESGSFAPRVADDIERQARVDAPEESAPRTSGFVEMADVERAIYGGSRQLRYCYTQARDEDEDLAGIMWLTMTLHEDGRIRGVVMEPRSTLRSEPMRTCLERRLYALSMPMPEGGSVTFSYPLEFSPSQ